MYFNHTKALLKASVSSGLISPEDTRFIARAGSGVFHTSKGMCSDHSSQDWVPVSLVDVQADGRDVCTLCIKHFGTGVLDTPIFLALWATASALHSSHMAFAGLSATAKELLTNVGRCRAFCLTAPFELVSNTSQLPASLRDYVVSTVTGIEAAMKNNRVIVDQAVTRVCSDTCESIRDYWSSFDIDELSTTFGPVVNKALYADDVTKTTAWAKVSITSAFTLSLLGALEDPVLFDGSTVVGRVPFLAALSMSATPADILVVDDDVSVAELRFLLRLDSDVSVVEKAELLAAFRSASFV